MTRNQNKTDARRGRTNASKREKYASDPLYREQRLAERKRHYDKNRAHALENAHQNYLKSKGTASRKLFGIRKGAKRRQIPFHIDKNWFLEHAWNQPCHYCGEICDGIDRINNAIGYEPDNCVPCCYWCNTIKLTYTVDEMIAHIKLILRKHQNTSGILDPSDRDRV